MKIAVAAKNKALKKQKVKESIKVDL